MNGILFVIIMNLSLSVIAEDRKGLSFKECYHTYSRSSGGLFSDSISRELCQLELSKEVLDSYSQALRRSSMQYFGTLTHDFAQDVIIWEDLTERELEELVTCVGKVAMGKRWGIYRQEIAEQRCYEGTIPKDIDRLIVCMQDIFSSYGSGKMPHDLALAKCEEIIGIPKNLREGRSQ